MTTPTTLDALDYLLGRAATDPALLTDLLTRLGALVGRHPDATALCQRFTAAMVDARLKLAGEEIDEIRQHLNGRLDSPGPPA